jgi:hypothetical protein
MDPFAEFLSTLAPLSLFGVETSRGDGFVGWLAITANSDKHDDELKELAARELLKFSVVSGSIQGLLLSVMVGYKFPAIVPLLREALNNLSLDTNLSKKKLAVVDGTYDCQWPLSLRIPGTLAIPFSHVYVKIASTSDSHMPVHHLNIRSCRNLFECCGRAMRCVNSL